MKDLLALGWIDHMPKLMGVQAAGSNYLAEAWEQGEDVLTKPPIDAQTRADSISAGLPRDRLKAMAAVVETGGAFVTVSDEEILTAIPLLARGSGVFGGDFGLICLPQFQQVGDRGVLHFSTGDRVPCNALVPCLAPCLASPQRLARLAGIRRMQLRIDIDILRFALRRRLRRRRGFGRLLPAAGDFFCFGRFHDAHELGDIGVDFDPLGGIVGLETHFR